MTRVRWIVVLLAVAAGLVAAEPDPELDRGVQEVLTRDLKFSPGELAELRRGKTVRHAIESHTPGEVAMVGAVRVNAPKAAFFARVRDITRFKHGPGVLQIGRFSQPPTLDDLAALTVDTDDFDVRNCHVGDCGIRLPAGVIRRFQQDIDPRVPDAQARGAALFKQLLFEDVAAYASGDPGRMVQYDDGDRPIRPLDDFDGLLDASPAIGALVPGLPAHLKYFPSARLPDAEDFLYWSKEKFGAEPFITVTHVTLICPSAETCVMTTKDVYSSRYFDASLAVAIASDAPGESNAFYLVYANRSRANALKGSFSGFRRSIVERRARGSLEESLKTIKMQLETGAR
jgi:hypothetical protein